jgi:nicotinate-nucleotide adenylyltransferase
VPGLLGGVFDPPHNGHVELLRVARKKLKLDSVLVLVVAAPGHKRWYASADVRLELAEAAFPGTQVELDPHARTVDMLRLREPPFDDPIFLIGADEFVDFPRWKDPERLLELTRLGVATRPGYPRGALESIRDGLSRPDRVELFRIEPVEVSSSEIRARLAREESIDGLVPHAVAAEIERLGLYRKGSADR